MNSSFHLKLGTGQLGNGTKSQFLRRQARPPAGRVLSWHSPQSHQLWEHQGKQKEQGPLTPR